MLRCVGGMRIKHLNLTGNNIGDAGAKALAEMLKVSRNLVNGYWHAPRVAQLQPTAYLKHVLSAHIGEGCYCSNGVENSVAPRCDSLSLPFAACSKRPRLVLPALSCREG